MTQDDLLVLAQGRVPAQPILAAVIDHIKGCDDGRLSGPYLEVIAEKSGQPFNTLQGWVLRPERFQTLAFVDADRLLCATHLSGMWYGEFREWYSVVDVTWRRCECPGCDVLFRPRRDTAGASAPRYCSKACRGSASDQRRGITSTCRKDLRATCLRGHEKTPGTTRCRKCETEAVRRRAATHCRKGHERTYENTMMLKNGKVRCRVCHNATSNAGYTRRRDPVAA